jgi:hypothetical protein
MLGKIKASMGKPIRDAIVRTPFSEAFIAALVANESSGDPAAKRFEPEVFCDLALVLAGRKAAYDSIGAQDLTGILTRAGLNGNPLQAVTNKLMDLATSWGPTQIMGYETVAFRGIEILDLEILSKHFGFAVTLLDQFVNRWTLKFSDSWVPNLLRCWNTGRPDGVTEDPEYVNKGMARMGMYQTLA